MSMLRIVSAIPTWLATNLYTPLLPKGHPWKNKWFGLVDWAEGESEVSREFDRGLWLCVAVGFIAFCVASS